MQEIAANLRNHYNYDIIVTSRQMSYTIGSRGKRKMRDAKAVHAAGDNRATEEKEKMNIDDFRYVTTIAALGSFTNAAKQLFIAQPSLSQRVKHIESTYDINIFIRDAKGVRLTDEGERFVRYAKQILESEEDLRKEIADMHEIGGKQVRIGTSQFINSHLFDNLIYRCHKKHPRDQYEFVEQTSPVIQQLLLAGKVDIAVCYLPVTSSDLKYEIIYNDRFVLVPAIGSELEAKIQSQTNGPASYVNVEVLDGAPFAIATIGTRLHQCIMSIQEKRQIKPDIQHFGKNFSMLHSIARKGIASTILYESVFDPDQDHIPYYYLDGISNTDLSIAVMWRKGTYLRQAAKNLIEVAREISQQMEVESAADQVEEQKQNTCNAVEKMATG
jgi:DNA-binding transcriptional LysR family regulator